MLDPTTLALIKQIDDASTAIGTRIQNFITASTNAGGATPAEINAALAPEVSKLTALAADPNAPVPVV